MVYKKNMEIIDYERLGSYLRQVRLARGLKQEDVAKQLGVGQPWISALERGTAGILSIDTLVSIGTVLDVPIDNLLREIGYESDNIYLPQDFSEEDRDTVRKFIDFLSWQR